MNLESINNFKPIDLDEINRVKLMKRTDRKFVLPSNLLTGVFQLISENYLVLEINKQRLMNYHTVYYDTKDYELYKCHHNGKLNRYKIRKRIYLETGACFLEIKFKNNKGRTIKERIESHDNLFELSDTDKDYLKDNFPIHPDELIPQMSNRFIRMTLANKNFSERCTIDCDIEFYKEGVNKNFDNLIIIEVKQDGYSSDSPLMKVLNELRIKPIGFSKYCMGSVLTNPDIKKNAFKARIRKIEKLTLN